ncbi:MAG: ribosome-binding factor A [Opitutia bacterium TMED67]|nr:ribosome-binding factor A [Verrucomicrobiales bacterium]OUU72492.1 MAG: ribosome-binding factor A [Opitutae bacterium TMED67]|tara:strand:+ start:1495 stop:1881 length:387 start_codon:yes stop_codon:yes gene_type:complete
MQNLRHMRVRELLKRELNEIFRREFPVELGIVSVTEVGVSNDLHSAKVFVSSIGDDKSQQKAFRTVRKSAGKIQFELGQIVALRYTPKLKFVMDEAYNRGDRVLKILDEIEQDHQKDNPDENNEIKDY